MSIRKREHVKSVLGRLNTRGGKVGAIAILFVLMATATAAVFSMDYATATATTQNNDVKLELGADTTSAHYPAVTSSISDTCDYATVGIGMFPSVTQASLQPATYYTDVLRVKNDGNVDHIIKQIVISDVFDEHNALGEISVYCWKGQPVSDSTITTDLTSLSSSLNADHVDIYRDASTGAITISDGGVLETGQTISGDETYYIGIVAHASSTASIDNHDGVSFDISIQWA